jgi:hypothetical protein
MLTGECKKCGERYYGWALSMPEQQKCSKCGSKLTIGNDAMKSNSRPLFPNIDDKLLYRTE